MRVSTTLVAGLHSDVVADVAGRMLAAAPGRVAVVEHDVGELPAGRVVRTLRDASGSQHLVVDLDHGCAACAVRESLLPALAECARHGRYEHVVVALPPALEPDPVARALVEGPVGRVPASRLVDLHAVVTAADPARVVADADSGDTLRERGLACGPDDDRYVAETLIRQVEHADILVGPALHGPGADLLAHLNPAAPLLPPALAGNVPAGGRIHDAAAAALRREDAWAALPVNPGRGPVRSLAWCARRPLHPGRLHAALDRLVPAVLRVRGHVWLATAPHERFAFATTGPRFELRPAGGWLSAADAAGWAAARPGQRAGAALDWDPDLGDRGSRLVLTGLDYDAASGRPTRSLGTAGALHDLLDSTMLTAAEVLAGPASWRLLPDPFAAATRRGSGAPVTAAPRG